MRRFAPFVLAGWFLTWSGFAQAQDWSVVRQLPVGSRLRIELPAQSIEATLRSVDDKNITVNGRSIPRDEVLRIDRIRGQKARGALIGVVVGLSVGVIHSYAAAESNKLVFGLFVLGPSYAVVGGLLGMGFSSPKIETVYRR